MSMQADAHALLTPAMRSVLSRIERAGRQPFHTMSPAQARAAYEAGAGVLEVPQTALQRVQNFVIPGRGGHAIAARLYAPSNHCLPVLVYFHGGGFTVGSVASHDTLCRQLSLLAGCAVVSVDYRLAPAHRFPAAVDDAWDAVQWLATHAGDVGLNGGLLAVGGDSAGGTLAAVCAIHARDAGLALALQLLFYPGCSAHPDTPSHRQFGRSFVLEARDMQWFFAHYLRTPADRDDWRFAPLKAPDLDGVAPAWLGLAECDPLVDEGVLYADKLRAAGVAVDLEIYRGVTHEFIKMGRAIPEARLAHSHAAAALVQAFN